MAFTTEAMETPLPSTKGPSEFDLPSKEFIGYDPKGTTTITGSPIQRPENPKQEITNEESAPVSTEETVALSPKISALARKEQAQRQRELKLKQREQDLADKLAKAEKYDQLRSKLENKDYSAADELGMTYEEYTNYLLKKQESADPKEERYLKVEKELEAIKKQQEERETREYQANQSLWKQEISRVVTDNEEFSIIKELKAEGAVLKHINDSFDEDDIELSAEQAAKEVAEFLKKRAEKFANALNPKKEAKVLGPPKASSPKTITQNMTVTSKTPSSKPFHLMSESEQIAEAYRRVQEAKLTR
jgi:hypothetical protein